MENNLDIEALLDEAASLTPQDVNNSSTDIVEESQSIVPDTTVLSDIEQANGIVFVNNVTPQTEEEVGTENIIDESEHISAEQYRSEFTSDITSRFRGADWYDKVTKQQVLIGGAGGISSWLAILLSRTNVQCITVYDHDIVETANMSGQFYTIDDVGDYKVRSLQFHVQNMSDYYNFWASNCIYDEQSITCPIMMCGFDNMEARKVFFNKWLNSQALNDPINSLYIDGRLSADCFQIYCVQGDDKTAIEKYKNQCLFDDSLADQTVCSYKQTSYMASMIASMMVNIFVNWCSNLTGNFKPVPFFTEYEAPTMQMKFNMNTL